jgi:hypothetical protein
MSVIAGTFVTCTIPFTGQLSEELLIPNNPASMTAKLTLTGLNGSNTVKTRKRTTPEGAWVDQVTYNSDQAGTSITVAAGERWQLVTVAAQTMRDIRYKLTLEN